MPDCGDFHRRRQHSATTVHRALPVCEWPALEDAMGHYKKVKCRLCSVHQVWWSLHWRCGRWFAGVAVLSVCGDFQRNRQHSAATVHRALPVCDWLALGGAMGHCKVKFRLCSVYRAWWSLD